MHWVAAEAIGAAAALHQRTGDEQYAQRYAQWWDYVDRYVIDHVNGSWFHQLDVRSEAEIFDRILENTRGLTTILISHRFATVRHADLICVLEHGKVIELGSHDELMAKGGRYRTMFDLQAARFEEAGFTGDPDEESEEVPA